MKKIVGLLIAIVVIGFLVLGIIRKQQKEEVLSIDKIQKIQGVPVLVEEVELGDIQEVRRFYGTVRSAEQTVVSSKLMERIERIYVQEGDFVKKNQSLVEFDTTASQVQVNAARLALKNAETELARMEALYKAGAVSRQTLDRIKLQHDLAEEQYKTAHRSVILSAPIDGRIARIDFKEGAVAHPGDPVLMIISDTNYEIVFDVPQKDRDRIRAGQSVEVHFNHHSPVSGSIDRVSYETNENSRLFQVQATIPRREGIYPGILATVDVTISEHKNVLSVPLEALIMRNGKNAVIRIDENIAHVQPVETGLQGDKMIEIAAGLKVGDLVAVYGHSGLTGGEKVRITRNK